MNTVYTETDIPEIIKTHIKEVIKTSSLPDTDESFDNLINGWLEKKHSFEDKMIDMGMEETNELEKDDKRAALALTYSGSLITLGPLVDGIRTIDYTSIGFRDDVPGSLTLEDCDLTSNISIDMPITFNRGPIKQTSPIFKIVTCTESLSSDEQSDMVKEATTIIIDDFVNVNKEIMND